MTKVAIERVEATFIGIAGTLVVMLILLPLAKHFQRKTGASEY